MRALALPVPGQEFIDAPGGMVVQAREDVDEPGLRVDIVEFGGLDEGVDCGGAVGRAE